MPLWSRIANTFRGDRLSREIDEELRSHIEEALKEGRDPNEARKAFGSLLREREASLDIRLLGCLDSLRADVIFGCRMIWKTKATSIVAILSLVLAIGSCVSAFRIIDALLLRPLPIRDAQRLYVLARKEIGPDGSARTSDGMEYPLYQEMRHSQSNVRQGLF